MTESRGRLPSPWLTTLAIVAAVAVLALAGGAFDDDSSTDIVVVQLDDLPPEVSDTVDLVEAGGPFPYEEDGAVYGNREGILPEEPDGYYREFTVETLGSSDRGARRLVTGNGGEVYYTDDHYVSFVEVQLP